MSEPAVIFSFMHTEDPMKWLFKFNST